MPTTQGNRALLVAQLVKNLPAMQETWVWSLGFAKIAWRRKRLPTPVFWPGEFHGLSTESQRVRHDWATFISLSHGIIRKTRLTIPAFKALTNSLERWGQTQGIHRFPKPCQVVVVPGLKTCVMKQSLVWPSPANHWNWPVFPLLLQRRLSPGSWGREMPPLSHRSFCRPQPHPTVLKALSPRPQPLKWSPRMPLPCDSCHGQT